MEEDTFDVVVIGSGFAGLRAALSAQEEGARVVVLEKMASVGGNSLISDGGLAAAGTAFQKTLGIEDAPEIMETDMQKAGGDACEGELVRIVAEKSREVFAWVKDVLGVPFREEVELFGGHSVARSHSPEGPPSGRPFISRMKRLCERLGVDIRTHQYVTGFIRSNGRIMGVECVTPYQFGKPLPEERTLFWADKGTIIASGGFAADVEFRRLYDERLDASIATTNKPSATGEVVRAAQKAGAAFSGMEHIQLAPWTSPDEEGFGAGPLFADYVALPRGILVGKESGKRFVNELADRRLVVEAILALHEEALAIADQAALEQGSRDIQKALEKGVVRRYETMSDLAEGENLPEEAFLATITRFNGFVAKWKDDDFHKPLSEASTPISTPPFYAMRIQPKTHHTMGGIRIDRHSRVLDEEGTPIKGLYAAGEAAGGLHGKSRLGSAAITDCLVFGVIAGRSAANEL